MDYATWIREQLRRGASVGSIAIAALRKPLATNQDPRLSAVLEAIADRLEVSLAQVHVVGSTRYGFSLRHGTPFDPGFSDLDLAVIDPELFRQCEVSTGQISNGPRFPELELPISQQPSFRRMVDGLSRCTLEQFAYVSIAVFPDLQTLIDMESARIAEFLNTAQITSQERASPATSFGPDTFDTALDSGFPCFLSDVRDSPPHKASPYIVDHHTFGQAFGASPARQRLLNSLNHLFADLDGVVEVACCLVGGSFIDPDCAEPRDIDIVVFYRATDQPNHEPGRALQRLTRKYLARHIDAHFAPCDVEPWIAIKIASFFTTLFQVDHRTQTGDQRGLVLLVPHVWQGIRETADKDRRLMTSSAST